MKKLLVLLVLLMLLIPPWALAAENLIQNGDFEAVANAGIPSFWQLDMWQTRAGTSALTLSDVSYSGTHAVEVRNLRPNDARFIQQVSVEPNTHYKISCMVRVQDCDPEGGGASIAVMDTFVGSDPVYDTDGAWEQLTLYGITGPDQYEVTVMARLGDYGLLATGVAWFDDFLMERLENALLDEEVYSFATVGPEDSSESESDEAGLSGLSALFSGSEQAVGILLFGALFAALCALYVYLTGRGQINLDQGEGSGDRVLFWVLAIALLLRLLISLFVRGYGVDMDCFEGWSSRLYEGGLAHFYAPEEVYFCDYPPGYMYVLGALGWLKNVLRVGYDSNLEWMLLKLPSMLMDVLAAWLLFALARKHVGKTTALMLAALYAFNPAGILNSAAWGQIDAVLALLLLLSVYFVVQQRWLLALPIFGIAVLVKPQALMFGPIGLTAYVIEFARLRRDKKRLFGMIAAVPATLALMLLLATPFLLDLHPELLATASNLPESIRPIGWLVGLYTNTLGSYPHLTVNACNLYALLDQNWAPVLDLRALWQTATGALPVESVQTVVLSVLSWLMMGLSYLYSIFLYVKAKDRRKLPLVSALVLALCYCFGAKMHERYLFPALLLLLLAFIENMDMRLLIAFIAFSTTQFVNAALVLRSEHLQAAEQIINAGVSLANILTAVLLCWTAFDLCVRGHVLSITRVYQPDTGKLNPAREAARNQFMEGILRARDYRLNLRLRDYALMAALTAVYALLTFSNLGVMTSPQTQWTSSAPGEQITIDLGEVKDFRMTYYGAISSTNFTVQVSEDGEAWSKEYFAEYNEGVMFRWLWYRPLEPDDTAETGFSAVDKTYPTEYPLLTARYVRLTTVAAGLILCEIAFIDSEGVPLPITAIRYSGDAMETGTEDTKLLFDEQHSVPVYPSYLNGTYFDEIYHARTAYENLHGMHSLEFTHPPLGKLLIAVGIKLFGMTPFGWRFMGALFGVLMIPLMYLLAKQLLRRTSLSFVAAFLLAVDCMHFTQTRIATIDSFAVFFIMLMYLFMIRYAQMSFFHVKLWRTLVPLGLCGIAMALAIASKWIGIYAAVGLAVLLFYTLILRYRQYRFVKRNPEEIEAERPRMAQRVHRQFIRSTVITLLLCVLFFVVIPVLIYYVSYYWQLMPDGKWTPEGVWDMQFSMLRYHAGLGGDPHRYRSPWYQWPFIAWPMWYYTGRDYLPYDVVSSISCMGNPAVWWGGLVSMLFVIGRTLGWIWKHISSSLPRSATVAPVGTDAQYDKRYMLVLVGFLSQYLPWVLVPRSTFIYHYFASVPFIILATGLLLDFIRRRSQRAFKASAILCCVLALLLFVFFYPIISGTEIPRWYANTMSWFHWENFN